MKQQYDKCDAENQILRMQIQDLQQQLVRLQLEQSMKADDQRLKNIEKKAMALSAMVSEIIAETHM